MFALSKDRLSDVISYVASYTILWLVFPRLIVNSILCGSMFANFSLGWLLDPEGPTFHRFTMLLSVILISAFIFAIVCCVRCVIKLSACAMDVTNRNNR